jgi:hypothetical protein
MGTDPKHLAGSPYTALADALFDSLAESTKRLGRTVEANADALAHVARSSARFRNPPEHACLDSQLRRFAAALLEAAEAFEKRRVPSEETRATIRDP